MAELVGALLAATIVLSSCAQTPSVSPAATSLSTASATASDSPPSPTPTSSPSGEPATPSRAESPTSPTTFTSTHYRYRFTLPVGTGAGAWTPAIRPWDGRQILVRAGPHLDRTLLPQGGLFLTGIPTSKNVDGFAEEIALLYQTLNRCQAATEMREVEINGVPARAFNQSCPEGLRPSRVVMVKDGYGILAFHTANPADRATALDRLVEVLHGLEWLPA